MTCPAARSCLLTRRPARVCRACALSLRLAHIREEYSSGRMLSGEIKAELTKVITPLVLRHQQSRAK